MIYDVATEGAPIWGPQTFDNVTLVDGKFNVILGETDEAEAPRSIIDAFSDANRFLGIKIGPAGGRWELS